MCATVVMAIKCNAENMKLVYFINESYYTINVNAVSNDSTNDG
jgi:hypothetical protein